MNEKRQFIKEYVEARGGLEQLSEDEKNTLLEMDPTAGKDLFFKRIFKALDSLFLAAAKEEKEKMKDVLHAVNSTMKVNSHIREAGIITIGEALVSALKIKL